MACRRRCHKNFFLLLFSSRKNTNTGSPHHSGALRGVKFDIFWLEGDGILLTLCENANQNVSKCAWSFPSNPHFFFLSLSVSHIFEVAGEYTEIEFMVNQHFLKCAEEKLTVEMWTCMNACVDLNTCILHLRPWLNIHNATVVPSLLMTLSAPNVAWSLVYFHHRSRYSAPTHCLSLHHFANGKHFSVDLTLLILLHAVEKMKGKRMGKKQEWGGRV